MDKETEYKQDIGRRVRVIVRQPNGVNSVWTGLLLKQDANSLTIKTDRGEERTEPKVWASIEWLSPAKPSDKAKEAV